MNDNLEIQYLEIERISPYARNARTHSKEQISQIARSVEAFGFLNPVLVDESGQLIAGHARVLAAQQLGLKLVPAICISHLSEAERRAYTLADNKLADNAGWDEGLLKVELEFLTSIEVDFDVDLTGFSTTEADLILSADDSRDNSPLPDLPKPQDVISRPGDIWQLDRHRVICGDCRNPRVLDQVTNGALASMVITDPPFNVPIDGHVSGLGQHRHREFAMASGEMSTADFTTFLEQAMVQLARSSMDGSLHYLFIDWRHLLEMLTAGKAVYKDLVNLCVWNKTNAGMGSLYRSQHELVLVFKHGTEPHRNNVQLGRHGRYRTNVWSYAGMNAFGDERDESLAVHPTVKPVALLADAIQDVTERGDIVLDGFLGSGSTLIAAESVGRICYGVEIDPAYVDVTVERWESVTGRRAIRQQDGLSWAEASSRLLVKEVEHDPVV